MKSILDQGMIYLKCKWEGTVYECEYHENEEDLACPKCGTIVEIKGGSVTEEAKELNMMMKEVFDELLSGNSKMSGMLQDVITFLMSPDEFIHKGDEKYEAIFGSDRRDGFVNKLTKDLEEVLEKRNQVISKLTIYQMKSPL